MQFEIENHFYSMMERLCMYVDETSDHIIEELAHKVNDNVIASDILMFATSVGNIDTRINNCFNHIRAEFKHSSEATICRIIHNILTMGHTIERENVLECM